MATALNTCPCCGGTNLEEDSIHVLVACMDCGTAQQGELTSTHPDSSQIPTSSFNYSKAPSKTQLRVFSNPDYDSRKLGKLVKQTVKMAEAVKLSKAQSNICVDQAKELIRRRALRRGMSIDQVSAALVYMAWKRINPCVSAWDMMNTGVKSHVILKVEKRLCDQHSDVVSATQPYPQTDEERLSTRLDRFPPIVGEERKKVLAVALDIWSVVINVKVQELNIRKIAINDYCILAVALEYVRRKKLPKCLVTSLTEKLSMSGRTVETRIWVIKKALLTLAAHCPCLEQDVKDRVITTQNVQRFLDRIIQNKEYLATEMELIKEGVLETEDEDGEKTKGRKKGRRKRPHSSVAGPVFLANEESRHRDGEGEEEEAHLSDLDDEVEEYILTEKEVEFRKFLMSTEDEGSS